MGSLGYLLMGGVMSVFLLALHKWVPFRDLRSVLGASLITLGSALMFVYEPSRLVGSLVFWVWLGLALFVWGNREEMKG